MRIIDISKKDRLYTVTLDSVLNLDCIFIDSLYNIKNVGANKYDLHQVVIYKNDMEIVDNTIILEDIDFWCVDPSAFIMTARTNEETTHWDSSCFFYDREEVYYAEICKLLYRCEPQTSNRSKKLILQIMLNKMLLEDAIANELLEDCVCHYLSLAKLLDIDINNVQYKSSYLNHGHGGPFTICTTSNCRKNSCAC